MDCSANGRARDDCGECDIAVDERGATTAKSTDTAAVADGDGTNALYQGVIWV